MPKLPKTTAKKVEATETTQFEALPADKYLCRLMNVEQKPGNVADYWSWEFEVIEPDEFEGRRLWANTSLSEKAFFKLKEAFEAFGVSPDTDTDELCGESALLVVSQRPIEKGARKGEMGNNVDVILPADGAVADSAGDEAEDEDLF